MKNLLFVLGAMSLSMFSCDKDDTSTPAKLNCDVKGRWVTPFNVLYEFTDSLKYTLYSTDGTFGSITPGMQGKPWEMQGDTLVIHNSSTSIAKQYVEFDCACNVMRLTQSSMPGSITINTYRKEGFDYISCK